MRSRHTSLSHQRTGSRSSIQSNGEFPLSPGSVNGELANSIAGGSGQGRSLGNLEDELGDAFEEGEEDELEDMEEESQDVSLNREDSRSYYTKGRDQEAALNPVKSPISSPTLTSPNGAISSPKKQRKSRHTRTESRYDGSEYDDSDDNSTSATNLPPEVRMLIHDVEELVNQGSRLFLPASQQTAYLEAKPNSASKTRGKEPHTPPPMPAPSTRPTPDATVSSLLTRLRDLGQQATLETQASRLITAHTSLSTHVAHQTRALQTAAFPLLSPLNVATGAGPSQPDIDSVLQLLSQALELLPQPSFTSLNSLSHLTSTGRDAVASLATLSDSLHMSRQVEASAARRLKSARDTVGEIRKEYELEEVGRRFIENGAWDRKLEERQARRVCNEVTGGFEEVCESWRQRLVEAQARAAEVGA